MSLPPTVIADLSHPHIRILRFARPDLREVLYDAEPIRECRLFQDLLVAGLAGLPEGGSLIVNFGLLEWFPSIFFRVMMEVRHEVLEKKGHLYVCNLHPHIREAFDLMGGSRLFEVRATESRAIHDGMK